MTDNVSLTPWGRPGNATAIDRFQEKVNQSAGSDACWPWTGAISSTGYGAFRSRQDHLVSAHVFALELAIGRRLEPGEEACHHCDNRPCCNPTHLYPGTRQDNIADAHARNRIIRGSARQGTSLLEAEVHELRHRFASGELSRRLADDYGVSKTTISNAINGKTWTHVDGPIRIGPIRGRRPSRKEAP